MDAVLSDRMDAAAFAFRGYNTTNLGLTPELLEHRAYGPVIEKYLAEASALCTSATLRRVDLVKRVRLREETSLDSYSEAVCLIVAVELAQIEILREFHGVDFQSGKLAMGYSLGEVGALVAAKVYPLESLLVPILKLSDDCVELARSVSMGIVFSRGRALDVAAVEKLCVEVTSRNQGTIAISSYLSPNTVLVLGQNRSLEMLKEALKARFPEGVNLKKNPDQWPPIHTQIVRQKSVPDRASVMLETVAGGLTAPTVPIISCVTGTASYTDFNSRQALRDWVDHPQKLWSVIEKLLASDIHTLIHLGPDPNIIPATFQRLSIDVTSQLDQPSLAGLGLRAVSRIVRARPWTAQYLSRNASLLRAPLIEHVVVEDWLLENPPE